MYQIKTDDINFDKIINENYEKLIEQTKIIKKLKWYFQDVEYIKEKIKIINKTIIRLSLDINKIIYNKKEIDEIIINDILEYNKKEHIYINSPLLKITNFLCEIKPDNNFKYLIIVSNICVIYTNIENNNIKTDSKDIIKYIENIYINEIKNNELIIVNKVDDYIDNYCLEIIKIFTINNTIEKTIKINIFKLIIDNLRRYIINSNVKKIHSAIKQKEGDYLYKIINSNKFEKCLEVGMAFGISAFYILSNLKCSLISIDPNQTKQWELNGVKLLKELELNSKHELIEKKNYTALPEILVKYGYGSFDFIFIDGFHTFDYTLIDFFYAGLLIRNDGIITIDDALHPGVKKCVSYIITNYKNFRKIDSPLTVASFIKINDDKREWHYHQNF